MNQWWTKQPIYSLLTPISTNHYLTINEPLVNRLIGGYFWLSAIIAHQVAFIINQYSGALLTPMAN